MKKILFSSPVNFVIATLIMIMGIYDIAWKGDIRFGIAMILIAMSDYLCVLWAARYKELDAKYKETLKDLTITKTKLIRLEAKETVR